MAPETILRLTSDDVEPAEAAELLEQAFQDGELDKAWALLADGDQNATAALGLILTAFHEGLVSDEVMKALPEIVPLRYGRFVEDV